MAGEVVARRYRLEGQLGAGGMGVVWRATDLELGRTVALKRSHDGDGGQIRREARLGASVQHPNVVTVYDSISDGDVRWLVLEYLDARSLDELVRAEGPLPVDRAAVIGGCVAAALAALHAQGMIHRDVTPGNVLVTADGTAKLTDLGISSWAEATLTGSAQLGGTAGYIAPEVARGHEAGPAADVFSLGATLFAAIEGVSPWGSGANGPFGQVHRAADGRLEPLRGAGSLTGVLESMLSAQPARRPAAEQARALLTGETTALPTDPADPGKRRWTPGRPLLIGAIAAAVVVLAGGIVALTTQRAQPGGTAAADPLGDPRTADPCSLLTPNSLAQYGKTFLDPNLGNFGRCDLDTTLPGQSGTIVTSLALMEPQEYPAVPPVRGKLGPIQRPNADPATCHRFFTLPDLSVVDVSAARADHDPSGRLCAMADAVVGDAYAKVTAGPIGRRGTPFPAGSLARIDACTLLDDATLVRTVGKDYPVDRYFGNWSCSWGHDAEGIDLYYDREWPLAQSPPDDAQQVTAGNRLAFVDPVDDGSADECEVSIRYRTYTPAVAPIEGEPRQRDEVLLLDFTDERHHGDLPAICAAAQSLATVVANRLPSQG
jgi:eukaryotic-like serine/threonine-protein kinase